MAKDTKLKFKIETLYDDQDNEVGVILKYKDFEEIMTKLEDLHDIYEFYKRKDKSTKTISLEAVKKELFGSHAKKQL